MRFTVILLIGLLPLQGMSAPPETFRQAKKIIRSIYTENPISFYCNCSYKNINGKLRVDLNACGYQPRKNPRRAARIEWEHVVPAWWLGHQRQCWQQGGRKFCRKNDPLFKKAEADLMNLVPAIGEINGDRSNYRFGMLQGEQRKYGQCDMEIDFKQRIAEPPPHRRGDIARIYFYMSDKYKIKISKSQQRLFEIWNKKDPISDWERKRNQKIQLIK